jgi:hypothetical protein
MSLFSILQTKKRHDLFSTLLALVDLAPTRDSLTIEIPMDSETEGFVFAIVKKREEKKLKKQMKDLDYFGQSDTHSSLPNHAIITDVPEAGPHFIDDRLVSFFRVFLPQLFFFVFIVPLAACPDRCFELQRRPFLFPSRD